VRDIHGPGRLLRELALEAINQGHLPRGFASATGAGLAGQRSQDGEAPAGVQ